MQTLTPEPRSVAFLGLERGDQGNRVLGGSPHAVRLAVLETWLSSQEQGPALAEGPSSVFGTDDKLLAKACDFTFGGSEASLGTCTRV